MVVVLNNFLENIKMTTATTMEERNKLLLEKGKLQEKLEIQKEREARGNEEYKVSILQLKYAKFKQNKN